MIQTPAFEARFSRGFYQVEEESLYIPLHPARKFFSYLDSDRISLQIDNRGQLVFLQLMVPRIQWKRISDFAVPEPSLTADIRFLDFREQLPDVVVEASSEDTAVCFRFASLSGGGIYRLTDTMVCEVTSGAHLAALWISAIEDDRAALKMAAWRRQIRQGIPGSGGKTTLPTREIRG